MSQIVLFTLDGCSHCASLKKRLNSLTIPYVNIEVNSNINLWESVVNQTKSNVLPTIFIKNEGTDTGPVYVPGRDYQHEDEIVEIIQKIVKPKGD